MNRYNDLQRFKDKTNNQSLNLKGIMEQQAHQEKSDWPIINQIRNEQNADAALSTTNVVSVAIPELVSEGTFSLNGAPSSPNPASAASSNGQKPLLENLTGMLNPVSYGETPRSPPSHNMANTSTSKKRFAHLFTPRNDTDTVFDKHDTKNMPLKTLLEKIAKCR